MHTAARGSEKVVAHRAAAAHAAARPAATRRTRTVHVPVVSNRYSVATPASTPKTAAKQDPFAKAPVVEDTVGAAPADAATATAEPTAPATPSLPVDQAPAPVQATATSDLPDYAQQPPAYRHRHPAGRRAEHEMSAPDVDPESNEPVAATTSSPATTVAEPSATPATTVPDAAAAPAAAAGRHRPTRHDRSGR